MSSLQQLTVTCTKIPVPCKIYFLYRYLFKRPAPVQYCTICVRVLVYFYFENILFFAEFYVGTYMAVTVSDETSPHPNKVCINELLKLITGTSTCTLSQIPPYRYLFSHLYHRFSALDPGLAPAPIQLCGFIHNLGTLCFVLQVAI